MRPDGMTLDNWFTSQANRWSFLHVDEIVATTVVSRGEGPVLTLTDGEAAIVPGLDEFLERSCTDGFLVLRGREMVIERYFNELEPSTPHLLMSVSKSLCSAVVGQYVASGQIDVDALVPHYLPELADTAYGDATVQQVLDMTISVATDDSYDDVSTRVAGWSTPRPGDPADTYALIATLRRAGEHGRTFAYFNNNTDVLAWMLERTSGRGYADVLARDLWSRIGAEHDAYVTVDSAGFPCTYGGVCATLRDLARFGRAVLDGALPGHGHGLIPAGWIADIRRGGNKEVADEFLGGLHPDGSYRNQFWNPGDERGSFYAAGAHGQYVWMDATADVVIAKLSTLPEAADMDDWRQHIAFFEALCRTLG
jgi:6-aminohexanoate-oligomer exohydrolase